MIPEHVENCDFEVQKNLNHPNQMGDIQSGKIIEVFRWMQETKSMGYQVGNN